jgi:hypothetical protein
MAIVSLALISTALAHDLARSESRLEVQGATVRCQLVVDLLEFPGVDTDANGRISYAELDRGIADVFARVKEHLVLRGGDEPSTIVLERHELIDEHTARLDLTYTFPSTVSHVELRSTFDRFARRPDHQHYVTISMGGVQERTILDAGHRSATFDRHWWTRTRTRTRIWLTVAAVAILGLRAAWFFRTNKQM